MNLWLANWYKNLKRRVDNSKSELANILSDNILGWVDRAITMAKVLISALLLIFSSNTVNLLKAFQPSKRLNSSSQIAYLTFYEVETKINQNFVNATFSLKNTTDGSGIVFNQDVFFLREVKSTQQWIQLSIPENANDRQFSKVTYSTMMDCCKLLKGTRSNYYGKIFMENFATSAGQDFGCPFKTNHNYKITNLTCTDTFLPPVPLELLFKFETKLSGRIKGLKGWTPLYSFEIYGKMKK